MKKNCRTGADHTSVGIDRVESVMADTQWCGCGAKPGAGLRPPTDREFGSMVPFQGIRPPTLPGYGVGAHGYDVGAATCYPDVCADFPAIYRLPDTSFNLDPMDEWHPQSSDLGGCDDPWAQWGYANGPKV